MRKRAKNFQGGGGGEHGCRHHNYWNVLKERMQILTFSLDFIALFQRVLQPVGDSTLCIVIHHSKYGTNAPARPLFCGTFHDCFSLGACAVGSKKGIVKVWDMSDGTVLHTIEDVGKGIGTVECCHDDRLIVVSSKRGISVLSFDTGEVLQWWVIAYVQDLFSFFFFFFFFFSFFLPSSCWICYSLPWQIVN